MLKLRMPAVWPILSSVLTAESIFIFIACPLIFLLISCYHINKEKQTHIMWSECFSVVSGKLFIAAEWSGVLVCLYLCCRDGDILSKSTVQDKQRRKAAV